MDGNKNLDKVIKDLDGSGVEKTESFNRSKTI